MQRLSTDRGVVSLRLVSIAKNQIGIAGWGGSGTSSAARGVVQRLGDSWRAVSPASDTFRRLAMERYPGQQDAVACFAENVKSDPSIDRQCDQVAIDYAAAHENFVLDARLAGMIIRDGLRVLLVCGADTRYQRIASRTGEKFLVTLFNNEMARDAADLSRYNALYGVSSLETAADSFGGYHLVIDTAVCGEGEVIDLIVEAFYTTASM